MITVYNTNGFNNQTIAIACNPEPLSKPKAVEIIERAYRNRRSTIDLLQEQPVMTLAHHRFKRLIFQVGRREIKKGVTETYVRSLNEVLFRLSVSRWEYHKTHIKIPTFTIKRGQYSLPQIKISWVDISRKEEFPELNTIKMTASSLEVYRSLPPCEITKELLNLLLSKFAEMDSFAWNYKPNGCADRTNLMLLYLRALKISPIYLQKAFVIGPNLQYTTEKGTRLFWKYHVAPLVTDKDEFKWVMDPVVSAERVMTQDEWASKVHPGVSNYGFRSQGSILPIANEKITFFTHAFSVVKLDYDNDQLIINLVDLDDQNLYTSSFPRFSKWQFLAECSTFTALEKRLCDKLKPAIIELKPFLTQKVNVWLNR